MTVFEYKDCRIDWLHQWVLVTLARNSDRLYTVADFYREWSQYDFVTESKLYRACARLREAELVHTHRESNEHIEDTKSYQLNDDGRFYVKEMGGKLASPPRLRLASKMSEMGDTVDYLRKQTDAQQYYLEQILEYLVHNYGMGIDQWEEQK